MRHINQEPPIKLPTMKTTLQWAAGLSILTGCAIILLFLAKAKSDGLTISGPTDYPTSGQFGDYIGGVVGTIFALSGTILLFLNFREQTKENKRAGFEAAFFEMLRLHRANVSELSYEKTKKYENRHVFSVIIKEFIECYREIKRLSNSKDPRDYLNNNYRKRLSAIAERTNKKIDIIELALINLAFLITYYGLSESGIDTIKLKTKKDYRDTYLHKLLFYMQLKPKQPNTNYRNWKTLSELEYKKLLSAIDELYRERNSKGIPNFTNELSHCLHQPEPYSKYYGGHQFRLGHYFRHLYQSYRYLDTSPGISDEERYAYGKMYRAQLSTAEQELLFLNSVSNLGMRWELSPADKEGMSAGKIITTYNLIKNVSAPHLSGIVYQKYYPDIFYEFDEQNR